LRGDSVYVDEPTRQFRDAMRLLFILTHCGEVVASPSPVETAAKVITSQKRLQKMDFWVRNPDHLAHALLDAYSEKSDTKWLRYAKGILDSEEPEVRRDAMTKYLFGAFEPIDTGIAPLISYGLVRTLRHPQTRRQRFFLLERGAGIAGRMEAEMPEARWYAQRSRLVGELCFGRSGEDLARMQYQQPQYANAPNGETIAPIAAEVRARLAAMEGHR
jgi:hypothetical protein